MIGINTTKSTVAVVKAAFAEDGTFTVVDTKTIDFSAEAGGGLTQLRDCLRPVLQQWMQASGSKVIAFLKCSEGLRSASGAAFKAEGIAQMLAHELGAVETMVTPQSLKRALGCGSGETWQDRSKQLLNPSGQIKNWTSKGICGAAAAAYKAASK